MEKIRKNRYSIAVYLIVLLIAIILIFAGKDINDQFWQDILINLATGLFGVALLFFLVDRFFLADEIKLSERIEQLIQKLELSERPSAVDFFVEKPDYDEYFRNASQIDLCGVTLSSTLTKNFGMIRNRLWAGAVVRILIVASDSLALEMSASRSENPDDVEYYSKRLESSLKEIGYLHESVMNQSTQRGENNSSPGSFEVRFIKYAPSFAILRFEGEKTATFVELYTHKKGYLKPPIFYLTPERDKEWYQYFKNQFDDMWNDAAHWEPTSNSKELTEFLQSQRRNSVPTEKVLHSEYYLPNQVFKNARTIYLAGFTLSRTIRQYLQPLGERLDNGATVRIVLLEPSDALLEEFARRSYGTTNSQHWKRRIENTVSLIEGLSGSVSDTGVLQLGYLPYIPSFGFMAIDPDTPDGIIKVEIYHHRSDKSNPTFELHASKDAYWYPFFYEQIQLMWKSCGIKDYRKTP